MIRTSLNRTAPRGTVLEDYNASLGEVLSARGERASFFNPIPALRRGVEDADQYGPIIQAPSEFGPTIRGAPPTPMLSVDEANDLGEPWGLVYDSETPRGLVDAQIERKKAEQVRNSVIARGRGGLVEGSLGLATELLVTATDPLNVASAFIPVVREARFASWATRYGPARARLARGTVEGAAGAAIVEPIILRQALSEQADYGLLDSLLNVSVGGLLGGGLHIVGGAAADVVARARGMPTLSERLQEANALTREAALRTSVAQLAEGRPVDVTAILRQDPAFRPRLLQQTVETRLRQRLAADAAAAPLPADFALRADVAFAERPELGTPLSAVARQQVFAANPSRVEELTRLDTAVRGTLERLQQARRRLGAPAEDLPDADALSQRSREAIGDRDGFRRAEQERRRALRPIVEREPLEGVRGSGGREVRKAREMASRLRELESQRGQLIGDLNRQARTGAARLQRQSAEISAEFLPSLNEDLLAVARRDVSDIDLLYSADRQASADADAIVSRVRATEPGQRAEAAQADAEEAAQTAEELERALGLEDERSTAALAAEDEAIAQAEALGRGLRAAAICVTR